jgi:hypothetical protein
MAKFSQEFLRQMASPMGSVQGGLLSAVKGAATLPQQLQERQKAQAMQAEMAKYTPGSPEYNAALARQQVGKGMFTEAGATGAAAIQQQQAATKATEEKARKGRLMAAALKKAARSNDPEGNEARVRNMTAEQLMQYLTPKERDTTVISAGGILADTGTGEILAKAPFKEQEQKNQVFELVKSGKWDPASISTDENGNIKWNEIEPLDKGDVDTPKNPPEVEREVIRRTKEATKKAVDFNRSRRLRSSILTSGDRSAGLVGDVRTAIFTLAGIRDKEESEKTQYLRRINTDILSTLPPGVASDTDVAIFSKGLPPASAGETEILEYLEVEERLLAAAVDKSRLYERHIQLQRDAGVTPTTAGIGDFEVRYANTMKIIEGRLQRKEISEQEAKRLFQTYIGFVPTYYQ